MQTGSITEGDCIWIGGQLWMFLTSTVCQLGSYYLNKEGWQILRSCYSPGCWETKNKNRKTAIPQVKEALRHSRAVTLSHHQLWLWQFLLRQFCQSPTLIWGWEGTSLLFSAAISGTKEGVRKRNVSPDILLRVTAFRWHPYVVHSGIYYMPLCWCLYFRTAGGRWY